MSRRLQFGSGPNQLPLPWENFDAETDIRKALPFPIGSAGFILAEHVIEHVDFRAGLRFLTECFRILSVGGVLRLAFPDITRDIPIEDYRAGFTPHYNRQLNCAEDVWLSVLIDWEHQACWTKDAAMRILLAVGFQSVTVRAYGYSAHPELNGVDGHHLTVGPKLARAETTIIEAVR